MRSRAFVIHKVFRLRVHAGLSAAVVAAGAHEFGLVADAFAVGAAILFFPARDAATGGVCAFLRGVGHVISSGAADPASQAFRA